MEEFDLFKLYIPEEDIKPRSHISCTGKELYPLIDGILGDLSNLEYNCSSIYKIIASKLGYHSDTVMKMLKNKNKTISLAVLLELLKQWKSICKKSKLDYYNKKNYANSKIEILACGSSYRTELKAVKIFNKEFAKILGAHHADGNLFKEITNGGTYYNFSIIDYHKSNLMAFKDWFFNIFGQKLQIKKAKSNAWFISLKNKIFGRYLEIFFGFPTSKKSFFEMPKIIKEADENIKLAYTLGFLTFDGSVETDRKISCGIKCKSLRNDLYKIVSRHLSFNTKQIDSFYHFTTNTLNKKELQKGMLFFESSTEKWFKLKDFAFGFDKKISSLDESFFIFDSIFPKLRKDSVTFTDLITYLKDVKIIKRLELAKEFKKGNSTMYKYVYILEMANILNKNKIGREHFLKFNENIDTWVLPNRPWFSS